MELRHLWTTLHDRGGVLVCRACSHNWENASCSWEDASYSNRAIIIFTQECLRRTTFSPNNALTRPSRSTGAIKIRGRYHHIIILHYYINTLLSYYYCSHLYGKLLAYSRQSPRQIWYTFVARHNNSSRGISCVMGAYPSRNC